MSGFSVVLDANVIYNGPVRDTILRALDEELFRGYWTAEIIKEAVRSLVADGRMTEERAQHLEEELGLAFPESWIGGYQAYVPLVRNHVKDRHILAAAIHAHAQVIVTFNIRHFPAHALADFGIEAQHPDVFLVYLYYLDPEAMVRIVRRQAADCKRPPQTVARLLDVLSQHVPRFAQLIQQDIVDEEQRGGVPEAGQGSGRVGE